MHNTNSNCAWNLSALAGQFFYNTLILVNHRFLAKNMAAERDMGDATNPPPWNN